MYQVISSYFIYSASHPSRLKSRVPTRAGKFFTQILFTYWYTNLTSISIHFTIQERKLDSKRISLCERFDLLTSSTFFEKKKKRRKGCLFFGGKLDSLFTKSEYLASIYISCFSHLTITIFSYIFLIRISISDKNFKLRLCIIIIDIARFMILVKNQIFDKKNYKPLLNFQKISIQFNHRSKTDRFGLIFIPSST